MRRCKSVIKAAFASSSNYMSYWGGVHAMNLFVNILHAMSMMGKNITDGSSPLGFLLRNSFRHFFGVDSGNFNPSVFLEFGIKGRDRQTIAAQFFKRIQQILDTEGVEYDNKVLVELINKHFPDWRRVLNECQRYSAGGKIDAGILATFSDVKVNDLVKRLKEKDYPEVRKWIVNNLDNDTNLLLRRIYDACTDSLAPSSIPAAVLVLAKYQYQMAFVADQEINMLACLTEIMVECEFK